MLHFRQTPVIRRVGRNGCREAHGIHKMADDVVCSHVFSRILVKNSGYIKDYVCNKCSVHETQLKEVLDELGSARLIIDILQKELQLRPQRTRMAMTWLQRKDSWNPNVEQRR